MGIIDPNLIASIAQTGLAGVGMFGLWNGYSLYVMQLQAPAPEDKAQEKEYERRHSSIKFFLLISLSVTLLTGGLELFKMSVSHESDIGVKISNYSDLAKDAKPHVVFKTQEVSIGDFGDISIKVQDKDVISVELGAIFHNINQLKSDLTFANNQLKSGTHEVGNDDPN
jgi:hypothetical protein